MPTNPDTLFQEASCFRCNSNASEADLLELALLDRISTAASSDSAPGLPLTSVQFNDGGVFGGDADLTWNKTTNLLSIVGGISMTAEANETPLTISGYSLTGANAQSMLSLAGTWNTSGTPTAIDLNITDTASNAASLLMNLRTGGTSRFSVSRIGGVTTPATVTAGGVVSTGAGAYFLITSRATMYSGAAGNIAFSNVGFTDFGLMIFGLATNLFPALKRSTTTLQVRLADDSAYAPFEANTLRTATAYTVGTLPAAGLAGRRAYVTDATAPTYNAALVGGGAVVTAVFDNGVAWVSA